jgi:hypothetical protein
MRVIGANALAGSFEGTVNAIGKMAFENSIGPTFYMNVARSRPVKSYCASAKKMHSRFPVLIHEKHVAFQGFSRT